MSIQLEQAEKTSLQVVKFMELVGILEQAPEEISDLLQRTSFSVFKAYLIRLNGLMRGIKASERHTDGETVTIGGMTVGVAYLPPKYEAREELLKEAFTASKDITTPKDKALLFYLIIQALHFFNDGNGRLGRLVYRLLNRKNGEKVLSPEEVISAIDHSTQLTARTEFALEVKPPEEIYEFVMREVFKDLGKYPLVTCSVNLLSNFFPPSLMFIF